jgi:hypothetical protein
MEGLVKEGSEVMEEDFSGRRVGCGIDRRRPTRGALRDGSLQSGLRGRQGAKTNKAASLLEEFFLSEEKQTGEKLAQLAQDINKPTKNGLPNRRTRPGLSRQHTPLSHGQQALKSFVVLRIGSAIRISRNRRRINLVDGVHGSSCFRRKALV